MTPYEHIISVSGGKDSTALYLLAMERGRPFKAVFADTGNEHELTYEFVRTLPKKTGGPKIQWVRADFTKDFERKRKFIAEKWPLDGVSTEKIKRALQLFHPTGNPFLDLCMMKGRFPSTKARFCTEELKVKPINEQVNWPILFDKRHVISWQGVRGDESPARAILPPWQRLEPFRSEPLVSAGRLYAHRPLLSWTIGDVWAIHKRHDISPNPLYAQGMNRVGCMPCIMCRKEELREIARRFPEHIERIETWEALVSEVSKRGQATFFAACDDPAVRERGEISHQTHGIRNHVEWSKTDRGGRQYNLITTVDFGTPCDQWGTCEAPV